MKSFYNFHKLSLLLAIYLQLVKLGLSRMIFAYSFLSRLSSPAINKNPFFRIIHSYFYHYSKEFAQRDIRSAKDAKKKYYFKNLQYLNIRSELCESFALCSSSSHHYSLTQSFPQPASRIKFGTGYEVFALKFAQTFHSSILSFFLPLFHHSILLPPSFHYSIFPSFHFPNEPYLRQTF